MNTTTTEKTAPKLVNGIDVDALRGAAAAISEDSAKGLTRWNVKTRWAGGARTDSRVEGYEIGGTRVDRAFTIRSDEPLELCGTNQHPNPQELLLASLNACMTVGYVAGCALEGIVLRELSIETSGDIDLRGFLGLDAAVKPGYDSLSYTVRIKADATPAQLQRIHDVVCRTSPNRFNVSQPIRLDAQLIVG